MRTRTPERIEFLYYLLCAAIEHNGYGFSRATKVHLDDANMAESYAIIFDRYEREEEMILGKAGPDSKSAETWRVDIDTMAKGLGIARKLVSRPEGAASWVKNLLLADRTNGDDGDYDVVGALLVLECAIFGEPTYN